jgi:hypothetical protein
MVTCLVVAGGVAANSKCGQAHHIVFNYIYNKIHTVLLLLLCSEMQRPVSPWLRA